VEGLGGCREGQNGKGRRCMVKVDWTHCIAGLCGGAFHVAFFGHLDGFDDYEEAVARGWVIV
jgi:hypothetical protein